MKDAKDEFDAEATLAEIKEARSIRKKRCTWGRSKLRKHQAELIKLKAAGATLEDMQYWLRKNKRIRINPSNISRFLKNVMAKE
ncbi:MAG: hypothetical protein Q8O24_08030 [Gallionellaceae bacterium]|nr:hypothetical protein [Gallionellaceae bacterium]